MTEGLAPCVPVVTGDKKKPTYSLTQDFSNNFYLNWPIQPISLDLVFTYDESSVTASHFKMKSAIKYDIAYFEWELSCFDILSRPIIQDKPIAIKLERDLPSGETKSYNKETVLPLDTKTVQIRLLNILFKNGQKLSLEYYQPILIPYKLTYITDYLKSDPAFINYLRQQLQHEKEPIYTHHQTAEGHWTCPFCGVLNEAKRQKCQLCESTLEEMEYLSERKLLDVYSKWKTSQINTSH